MSYKPTLNEDINRIRTIMGISTAKILMENTENNIDLNQNDTKSKPSIFTYTTYRLPTSDELEEVDSFNLTSDEILNGFTYTIVGKGIKTDNSRKLIRKSIQMLIDKYPENNEYKEALDKFNSKYTISNLNIENKRNSY